MPIRNSATTSSGPVEYVDVDTAQRLDRIHRTATRRGRGRRIRALAVAAVIGVFVVVLAWQMLPAHEGGGTLAGDVSTGRIAHLGERGSSWGLFDVDIVTGDVAPLYDGGAGVLTAAWSPEGSRLAYILEEPGPRYAIVVADADGSNAVTIVEEEDTGAAGPDMIDLSWSPDGSQIAYSGRVVEDGVARRTILIVDADGSGKPRALDGHWESVSWSPDGERLLISGFPGVDSPFHLYTVRPDGSDLIPAPRRRPRAAPGAVVTGWWKHRLLHGRQRLRAGHLRHGCERLERAAAHGLGGTRPLPRLVSRWAMDRLRERPGRHAGRAGQQPIW